MPNSRLVVIALLAAVLVAPAGAQSSSTNTASANADSLMTIQTPFLPDKLSTYNSFQNIRVDQFRLLPNSSAALNLPAQPNRPSKDEIAFGLPYRLRTQNLNFKEQQSDTFCLSIRSYRVVRDDPQSDTTRPAGYSTCQPASQYRVKIAVDRMDGQHPPTLTY